MDRVISVFEHPVYKQELEDVLKAEVNRQFCRHDMQHFLDVARISWILCLERRLDISKDMVYAAALLHDIGRGMQYRDGVSHDVASVILAEQILPECGYTADEVRMICDAIAGHRMSSKADTNRTGLGEVLEEADHASRCCFACAAEPDCYWSKEKKNLKIRM